ncbi:MAG: signal recognition particle protein [Gammaproteobacteria bacterium RIFCSPLOWO2_12_47_11]|nr:MAG: signal recognition particle protein [Gammaproteobacteria bacterium RIFCSPLOWO2_12_47_11]OGT86828.1 MAG: signal recognition particle protein [Gammaproteobacteria bacterium RIFCSPLOWO2_12_FULL_47_76]
MFETISERLGRVIKDLRGQGRLTEENISTALREVRMALLEADVALPVVREFIEHIRVRALGQEVMSSLTPGQAVIKIVNQEMVSLMGESNSELNLKTQPPAIILVAGLQGAGKTTTVAKLARYLKENLNKKVAVVSCDIYRPAAIDQLKTLANEIDVEFLASTVNQDPVLIVNSAVETARRHFSDVLIVDSAGRLHIDNVMMQEIRRVHAALQPVETLFIVDSMMGQDAVNAARSFNDALPLTGVVLTKTDGDARGGAALSVRQVTGKPIKFMGTGEKTSALTPFHPDRIASRILGMGDVLSLIEEVEQKADKEKAQKFAKKLQQGKRFTLDDFQEQLQQMRNMGGIGNLLDKLPGMPGMQQKVDAEKGNREFIKLEAIIHSMTPQERRKPDVINGSRKKRIATGSGTQIQDVNRLLKQFTQMQKMMKKFSRKGGMQNFMRGMGGKMPPGGMPF